MLASQQEIDMESVFTYPLTPIPLSLISTDGSMDKTDKSVLSQHLEELQPDSDQPTQLDTSVIDGNFLFHTLVGHNITTYGVLARTILIQITKLNNGGVDLLFDTYAEPSIKDSKCLRYIRDTLFQDLICGI